MRWFGKKHPSPLREKWSRTFDEAGIVVSRDAIDGHQIDSQDLAGLLAQLEDEGYAENTASGWRIGWDSLYALLAHPEYAPALESFCLPKVGTARPCLISRGALTDPDFSISIASWVDADGHTIDVSSTLGAMLRSPTGQELMPPQAWALRQKVVRFLNRPSEDRTETAQRREWSLIRRTALEAGARLDDFLYRTVVLTPERLRIDLKRTDIGHDKVVEVIPGFDRCPPAWLEVFDRRSAVPDRYDLATPEGIVQVLITAPVKTVLQEIKRMPGRRVAGTRGEAFITNPFATLGEDASKVIDAEQFEQARIEAGLCFERFTAHIRRDAFEHPVEVGLQVETWGGANIPDRTDLIKFDSDEDLARFIDRAQAKLDAGFQLCAWEDYEFELSGDTQGQIDNLRRALEQRQQPRVLVSYADVYDLSGYSGRIENIGNEKPYYSPYIAKRNDGESWFPENLLPLVVWQPDAESGPVAVPISSTLRDTLEARVEEAREAGRGHIELSGFPKPMPLAEAERIVQAFDGAEAAAQRGNFNPTEGGDERSKKHQKQQNRLVLKANIQALDYEEARRDLLSVTQAEPVLPTALKPEVKLKAHQRSGVAWLQHLFEKSPAHCRGAVLADDMGLGKTLQLLTLIAWAHETHTALDPALVVAPVSLLENWREEIDRFFRPGALSVLTAYGEGLAALRVPRAAIDEELRKEGLVRFLVPGWRGNARIVLTTYETLRDLEFSFAAEKWSMMICDEAQKVKTPSAMMTRAAKKQNVRFKVACTGTPVENTLADLWCLFDLVQPGILGSLNDFGSRYRKPIEAETQEEKARVEELRAKIAPQILRRTKREVAADLPEKRLVAGCWLPLSDEQRALYAHAVDLFRKRNDPRAASPFRNALGLLHYLRLICTDPRRHGLDAFKPEPLSNYRRSAPKLDWLLRTLDEIRLQGEKAIVFCEFRVIQRLLRSYIEQVFGFAPDIINGETTAAQERSDSRQKRLKAFQQKPGFGVIILSPVAVGFGVNIQGANHVIHYTRTWNPAKEDQATDRAYRIGQTKTVHVYCPIVQTNDFKTFDVKLDELLTFKRSLAEDMLNGAGDIRPSEFEIGEVVPGGVAALGDERIGPDQLSRLNPVYFEVLIAALWHKRGFRVVTRTPVHDGGIDVVAIDGEKGELVQCKSSAREDAALSWDAIKDVVTGAARYRQLYAGVRFTMACATNRAFNQNAHHQAELNNVMLYELPDLLAFLDKHTITLSQVERYLYADWQQSPA